MTVPLAMSTADYLTHVHNNIGPAWFRALAGELTAPDEHLRMRDMGDCPWPNDRPKVIEKPVTSSHLALAREIQMRLGEEAA